MSHGVNTFNSRIEWLNHRGIGGSSASAILGLSKYRTNRDLYYEIVNKQEITEETKNEIQEYGTKAEEHITALFELEHPQYKVKAPNPNAIEIWYNLEHEWMTATLDGQLEEIDTGRKGILEIKTMLVNQYNRNDWKDGNIPDAYYCQVLHYMLVEPEFQFAVIHCRMRNIDPSTQSVKIQEIEYKIEREQVKDDLQRLLEKEIEFWHCIETKTVPPLIINL